MTGFVKVLIDGDKLAHCDQVGCMLDEEIHNAGPIVIGGGRRTGEIGYELRV